MPLIKLGTGKRVTMVDEYGHREHLKAAELSEVPAVMSRVESTLLNYATIYVAVIKIDDKTQADYAGSDPSARGILTAFRDQFTNAEWDQLVMAYDQVFAAPKLLTDFEILSPETPPTSAFSKK